METGQPRFTDPDHVRETLCTGPCWTSGYTNDTMQIVLTATRHDVAMISEGRFTQPPDYVVVARVVMTIKGALELAGHQKHCGQTSSHDWTTTQQQRTCVTKTFR
jgi:hypothetical protein